MLAESWRAGKASVVLAESWPRAGKPAVLAISLAGYTALLLHATIPCSRHHPTHPRRRWLRQCEGDFLQSLASFTDREAFAADERIPSVEEGGEARMCILDHGLASRGGAILTSGASWGDLLVSSPMLRDLRIAKALGYCEIVTLTRPGLDEALQQFPASQQLIREAGLKIATQRAILVISMYARVKASRARKMRDARLAANGGALPAPNGEAAEGGSASAGPNEEIEAVFSEPSEVLLAMQRANLMPNVEWREVAYETTTENKAGKRPVALRAEGEGSDGGSLNQSRAGSPEPELSVLDDDAIAPDTLGSSFKPIGGSRRRLTSKGESSHLQRARAAAASGGGGGKHSLQTASLSRGRAGSGTSRSRSGRGGDERQLAALSRQQHASTQVIRVLTDEVKLIKDQLGRIERMLNPTGKVFEEFGYESPMAA